MKFSLLKLVKPQRDICTEYGQEFVLMGVSACDISVRPKGERQERFLGNLSMFYCTLRNWPAGRSCSLCCCLYYRWSGRSLCRRKKPQVSTHKYLLFYSTYLTIPSFHGMWLPPSLWLIIHTSFYKVKHLSTKFAVNYSCLCFATCKIKLVQIYMWNTGSLFSSFVYLYICFIFHL